MLFFDSFIESEILTDDDIDSFLQLLSKNDKLIGREWNILYRKSSHGNLKDEELIKERYENEKNVIFIVETTDDKVWGGYSSVGWKLGGGHGPDKAVYNHDERAYIFGIRASKNGHKPFISNVKPAKANVAIRSQREYYLLFGTCATIHIGMNGYLFHYNHTGTACYTSSPKNYHPSGGSRRVVKNLEIFQIKQ